MPDRENEDATVKLALIFKERYKHFDDKKRIVVVNKKWRTSSRNSCFLVKKNMEEVLMGRTKKYHFCSIVRCLGMAEIISTPYPSII